MNLRALLLIVAAYWILAGVVRIVRDRRPRFDLVDGLFCFALGGISLPLRALRGKR